MTGVKGTSLAAEPAGKPHSRLPLDGAPSFPLVHENWAHNFAIAASTSPRRPATPSSASPVASSPMPRSSASACLASLHLASSRRQASARQLEQDLASSPIRPQLRRPRALASSITIPQSRSFPPRHRPCPLHYVCHARIWTRHLLHAASRDTHPSPRLGSPLTITLPSFAPV
jgi:hypothetical protein